MSKHKIAKEVEEAAKKEVKETSMVKTPVFSTGSSELNLACSDCVDAAFPYGVMINGIGDSHAGKTVLAHSILAEAALNSLFDGYDLIYDNAEASETAGIVNLFGTSLKNRIKLPENGRSSNIHDFKKNVWKPLKEEKPFVYALDSLDSIVSLEAEKQLDAAVEGEKEKGSYNMEKQKVMSSILGPICRKLESTKSLLIILSQTRAEINPFSFQEKRRSGGAALKFYAHVEMWLGKAETHKKKVGEFERVIGHKTKVKITKNKQTGKVREADLNIYVDYGIDDIGTIIDFMVDGKFWDTRKNTILATDLELEGTKNKLIEYVESNNLEPKLKEVMEKYWKKIEDSMALNRKNKYV